MTNAFARSLAACFDTGHENVVHVPVLIKGELRFPPKIEPERIITATVPANSLGLAFQESGSVVCPLNDAWVIRQPLGGRAASGPSPNYRYQVLARPDPRELIETDQLSDAPAVPLGEYDCRFRIEKAN